MENFLIIYNRRTGESDVREFPAGRGREAVSARFDEERKHRDDPDVEVVVLSSSSRAELLKTHSRYFRSPEEILKSAAS